MLRRADERQRSADGPALFALALRQRRARRSVAPLRQLRTLVALNRVVRLARRVTPIARQVLVST
jgi:hypothetical protein